MFIQSWPPFCNFIADPIKTAFLAQARPVSMASVPCYPPCLAPSIMARCEIRGSVLMKARACLKVHYQITVVEAGIS